MAKLKLRKNLPLILTGLLALGVVATAAYVHQTRPKTNVADTTPATTPPPSGSDHPGAGTAGTASSSGNTTATTTPQPASPTDPQYNSSTLAKPTQSINKSHDYISLSSSDAQHSPDMDSTCTSVAGAVCEIHATMGSTTLTVVPAKAVDASNYGIDVAWNAKDKGLTPGTWTITAVASKDGQKNSSSPITIEVRA